MAKNSRRVTPLTATPGAPDAELLSRRDVEEPHLHGHLRVEDGLVAHGPLLGEGQAAQLRRLLERLLELERHVLGADRGNRNVDKLGYNSSGV